MGEILDELAIEAGPRRTLVLWEDSGEWRVDVLDATPSEIGPMRGGRDDDG